MKLQYEEQAALKAYKQHPRNRAYCLMDDPTKRQLTSLYIACCRIHARRADTLFHETLEKLSDDYGQNLLRPKQREPRKLPEEWRDSLGRVLPNPWSTGNKGDQQALLANNPQLATHLKRLAEEPYVYALELAREESERLAFNAREAAYGEAAHAKNVFVIGTPTDQAKWSETVDAETVEQYQRETRPVDASRVIGNARNVTLRNRIYKEDRALFAILEAATEQLEAIALTEWQEQEEQRRVAALEGFRQEQAKKDAKHRVERRADGRVITHAG